MDGVGVPFSLSDTLTGLTVGHNSSAIRGEHFRATAVKSPSCVRPALTSRAASPLCLYRMGHHVGSILIWMLHCTALPTWVCPFCQVHPRHSRIIKQVRVGQSLLDT